MVNYAVHSRKGTDMSKHSPASNRIPSILAIPDKLKDIRKKLLALRIPRERQFYGWAALLLLVAGVLIILFTLIRPLRGMREIALAAAAVLSLPVIVLDGLVLIRKKMLPIEEIVLLLASVIVVIVRDMGALAAILMSAAALREVEGYAQLHRDAVLYGEQEERVELREQLQQCDVEKSATGAVLMPAEVGVFASYLLLALIMLLTAAFHTSDWIKWLGRAAVCLILASPSASVCTIVLNHFGIFSSIARHGIVFSDDRVPEEYRQCRLFAFSKTGTVTDGNYVISEIAPVGISEQELLRIAAVAECRSEHPIAQALRKAAGLTDEMSIGEDAHIEEIPGKGVSALVGGHQIYVGNADFLDEHGIWFSIPSRSGSAIHVAVDNAYRGFIMIADEIREGAFEALEELRAQGASTLVMLTGDVRSAARTLASSLNFDMVKPELTPEEKASAVQYLRSVHGERARIVCVGDGYHDAEMFRQSDIAVCLNAENAKNTEVSIFSGDILQIPRSFRICRRAFLMLLICLSVLLGVKLALCLLGLFSAVSLPVICVVDAAFGIAAVIYTLTGLRLN